MVLLRNHDEILWRFWFAGGREVGGGREETKEPMDDLVFVLIFTENRILFSAFVSKLRLQI